VKKIVKLILIPEKLSSLVSKKNRLCQLGPSFEPNYSLSLLAKVSLFAILISIIHFLAQSLPYDRAGSHIKRPKAKTLTWSLKIYFSNIIFI